MRGRMLGGTLVIGEFRIERRGANLVGAGLAAVMHQSRFLLSHDDPPVSSLENC